ncbi:hypothetical protein [Psychrobacter pygoscelis]|uniref:hypothetical protein n=1 Tax=Psychrobacter pygoscelis TaxID=2488563 RepID=UPI00103B1385|nr:hypothetical protein [Psychrobacter pygoscelis]
MSHYFGFKPSDELSQKIDQADKVITAGKDEDYYLYRNEIAQLIARELIDNLLVNLVDYIPNPERQAKMRKIIVSIESSTETLLKVLLGKDNNQDVLPTFCFMKNESLFTDNAGERRVGFKLPDEAASQILAGFNAVTPESIDIDKFKHGLEVMNNEILTHFITRFAATLKLGMFKRNAVPVTKVAINKGLGMAINKLFPQLDNPALNRLAGFYKPFIVQIND